MKKINLYITAGLLATFMMSSCESPEYVDPTADRQGITSLTAYFTSGDYVDKEAVAYSIANDASTTDYVIPVPWYYPEESDNETTSYMSAMKVVAIIANNCMIDPPISVLDLTKKNYFTFTNPDGSTRQISISGQRTKSSKCAIKTFSASPGDLTGVIDEDSKTISLVTMADLSECTAVVTLDAHATISPDPAEVHNFNDGFKFTVTADNGTTTAVYTVKKQIPNKLASGYRKGSETELFSTDLQTVGVTDANAIHPTLACIGAYVVLDLGDGSTPMYFKKMTGTKMGTINLGAADATGCVTSDVAGNMLISNYAANGSTLKIYKTNSVTAAPKLLISYDNALNAGLGSRIHVQGDLNGNAIISATVDNSTNFIRWIVTNGVVGEPENVLISGCTAWGGQDNNAKVVARNTSTAGGYFFGYYDGGSDNIYYADASNAATAKLTANSGGSAWGYNNGALDTRIFNKVSYLALFEMGYWPSWGLAGHVYLYDSSSPSAMSGSVDASPNLKYTFKSMQDYTSIGCADDGRFGDVLLTPSDDGYFLYMFYVSNTHLSFGGIQLDCIDK
jgi:hypothetical protein